MWIKNYNTFTSSSCRIYVKISKKKKRKQYGNWITDIMWLLWLSLLFHLLPKMNGISQAKIAVVVGSTIFPPTHQQKGIFKYWCHAVIELARHMAGRWWPISGICSSSDSWYSTSLLLITAAWVWWTVSLGWGHHKGNEPRSNDTISWGSNSSPYKRELFSLQERSKNKHASRKNNCAPCIRCAVAPRQNINRSAQLYNRLRETCHVSWVTGSVEKEEPWR